MPQVTKGKCNEGKHKMVWKKDGDNRSFFSCDICGILPVRMERKSDESKILDK